jgi:hypothetical protein
MRERLGHDMSGSELLKTIVADRGGRTERFVRVPGIQFDLALRGSSRLRGIMSPDSRVAIGLQLELHRFFVHD